MNYYTEAGLAICQICNKGFHFITANHLNLHGIVVQEYHERYPDAPLFRKGFYDKPRHVKKNKFKPVEPIIEELSDKDMSDKDINENFDDDDVINELSKFKLKTSSGPKRTDPMEDKLDIIGYLKIKFQGIKNNYTIIKTLPGGNLEYQFVSDMADPTGKIVFEFPQAFWHNSQIGVADHFKQRKLRENGWRVIVINATMPRIKDVSDELDRREI